MPDTDANTSLPGASLPNTSQPPSVALNPRPDADEPHAIDPSNLTTYEKRLYGFLCTQGWSSTQCSCFIAQIELMKEAISHHFYSQGCNAAQVQCLHEQCEMGFPEHFPAPRGDADQQDLQLQLRLNDEMNRRRAIGERMYPSIATMDREIDGERRA